MYQLFHVSVGVAGQSCDLCDVIFYYSCKAQQKIIAKLALFMHVCVRVCVHVCVCVLCCGVLCLCVCVCACMCERIRYLVNYEFV